MSYSIDDVARDFLKSAQNRSEQADYYRKQGNYKQALEEYAESLEDYAIFLRSSERNFTIYELRDPSTNYGRDTQISILFWLVILFTKIENCYSQQQEYSKAAIFIKNIQEIIERLGKLKEYFNADLLKIYEKLVKGAEYAEATIKLRTNQSESESQSNTRDDSDATFKKLCLDFDRCCSYEICILPSRGVDHSTSSSSSSSCFIATAAYSTPTHPDLDTFRNFRDRKLLINPVGKQLVSLYYQISPSIAQYVEKQPAIKSFVRQQLERLAQRMRN